MAGFKSAAGAESDIAYHLEQAPTLLAGNSDASVVIVRSSFSQAAYDKFVPDSRSATLKAEGGSYGGGSETLIVLGVDGYNSALTGDKSATLGVNCGMSTGRNGVLHTAAVDCRNGTEASICGALQSSANHNINSNNTVRQETTVRRLTPLECERLQGFLDGWTNIGDWVDSKGKLHTDSDTPRYKALGNSIALPSWLYVLQKLSLCCGTDHTMASLFDGIGGFPFLWEMLHGKGSCVWASEIEEFPIAVTKIHFPEEE